MTMTTGKSNGTRTVVSWLQFMLAFLALLGGLAVYALRLESSVAKMHEHLETDPTDRELRQEYVPRREVELELRAIRNQLTRIEAKLDKQTE